MLPPFAQTPPPPSHCTKLAQLQALFALFALPTSAQQKPSVSGPSDPSGSCGLSLSPSIAESSRYDTRRSSTLWKQTAASISRSLPTGWFVPCVSLFLPDQPIRPPLLSPLQCSPSLHLLSALYTLRHSHIPPSPTFPPLPSLLPSAQRRTHNLNPNPSPNPGRKWSVLVRIALTSIYSA